VNNLCVFIDISGDYEWSDKGTPYLVVTSVLCSNIHLMTSELYQLKHKLISDGFNIERFHACDDCYEIKNKVFGLISQCTHIRIDSIIVDKRKINKALRPKVRLYPELLTQLLKYPFNPLVVDISNFDFVTIFTDRENCNRKEKGAIKKAIGQNLSKYLSGIPYMLCIHSSHSHPYLQVTDYCSWAIHRKWTSEEDKYYNKIKGFIKSEFPIFAVGETTYY
jgi:hypothetical protein